MAEKPFNRTINRLSKFFSNEEFNLYQDMGREFIEDQHNMSVILYRVDKLNTETDDIYGEVEPDEIMFLPPIEIKGLVELEPSKNLSYEKNATLRYNEHGNLKLYIYQQYLDELDIEVNYGDFLLYQEDVDKNKFFTVTDDGKIFTQNQNTMFGFKPLWRTITATPTEKNLFRGL